MYVYLQINYTALTNELHHSIVYNNSQNTVVLVILSGLIHNMLCACSQQERKASGVDPQVEKVT